MIKNLIVTLGAVLALCNMAVASGYDYEAGRMGGGAIFMERQTSEKYNSASPVEIKNEFAPVEKAKINAQARDYSKLTVKAPPALKSTDGGANKSTDNPLTDPSVIAGGLLVAGTVALAIVLAPEVAVIVAGGLVFAAVLTCIVAD